MTIALATAGAPLALGLALFRAAARGDRGLMEMGLLETTPSLDPPAVTRHFVTASTDRAIHTAA